jgi:hypothetical protein
VAAAVHPLISLPLLVMVLQHGLVEEAVQVARGVPAAVVSVAAARAEAERRLETRVEGVAVQGRARHKRRTLGSV